MSRSVPVWMVPALLVLTPSVGAQAPPPAPDGQPAQAAPEERSTGLPRQLKWTFNFDASWGTFGFANSLFNNPKDPGIDQDLSDQWFEGAIKPSLSGRLALPAGSELYGTISAVGERTYGSVPDLFGSDVSSFGPEDLSIGWRSGSALTPGDNAVDVTIGRTRYQLGNGFLLYDGSSEGGSRGGYWTNARKAFEFAAIGRFQPGPHKAELFYLDRDELDEGDSGSRLWGANYELSLGKDKTTTVGATYMRWFAKPDVRPGRDGLTVFNVRAYLVPLESVEDLSLEFEYAAERNGPLVDSDAWTLQGAYQFSSVRWQPKVYYRYAIFQGDDPATEVNESFDPLFPGFSDWGSWWQGEIAGEYFLSNSNLKSQLIRMHLSPTDAVGTGLLFFNFRFDQPESAGQGVTASDLAFEIDSYTDWKLNKNFTLSVVGAYADPGKGVQQLSGRTRNFAYGMVFLGYSF